MANGGGTVWIERDGRMERTELVIDEPMLHRFLAYGDADSWGKRRRQASDRRSLTAGSR
jgi:hypothetical protein